MSVKEILNEVRQGNSEKVTLLLNNIIDNEVDIETLLIGHNDFEYANFKTMIAQRAKFKIIDDLWEGSEKGDYDKVQSAIKKGVNVNIKNAHALKLACEKKHYKIIKLLLDNGANVNGENNFILMYAVFNDDIKVVKLLLKTGKFSHDSINCAYGKALMMGSKKTAKLIKSYW